MLFRSIRVNVTGLRGISKALGGDVVYRDSMKRVVMSATSAGEKRIASFVPERTGTLSSALRQRYFDARGGKPQLGSVSAGAGVSDTGFRYGWALNYAKRIAGRNGIEPEIAQSPGEFDGDGHTSVLASGTSNADGYVTLALAQTDERVRNGKPVSPAFLFAALLWHEVLAGWKARMEVGERQSSALEHAMDDVLDIQCEKLAITRRLKIGRAHV